MLFDQIKLSYLPPKVRKESENDKRKSCLASLTIS